MIEKQKNHQKNRSEIPSFFQLRVNSILTSKNDFQSPKASEVTIQKVGEEI
jgi:hypothetical protein